MEVALPDGTVILATGRLDLVPSRRPRNPDFALYLDHRWGEDPDVIWPFRLVGWEDFGLPGDEAEIFTAITDLSHRARAGELVEVACYGGLGRTGTVLGCLTVLAGVSPHFPGSRSSISSSGALVWVRSHYHPSAVETADQEALIERFAQTLPRP
jgi:protein tyrosine phosphatase